MRHVAAPRSLGGLVEWSDASPALVGGRCTACGTHAFPVPTACARCGAATVEPVTLPAKGTVWTWTVQRLPPKPPFRAPEPFEPFAIGYVDLGPVLVEARLDGKAPDAWRIGDPVELAVAPLPGEDADDGDARWSFTFRPPSGATT